MAVKYQILRQPVLTRHNGKIYTGHYRIDTKGEMMVVEYAGKSKQVQIKKTANVDVLAQVVLSQIIDEKM